MRAGRWSVWVGAAILALAIGVLWLRTGKAGSFVGQREPLRFVDVVRRPDTDDVLETLVAQERYAEAFDRALGTLRTRLDTAGALHPSTLSSLRRVGTVAHLSSDQRLAGEIFDALLQALRGRQSSDPVELGETLIRRGYTARYLGERERARQLYDEAEAVLQESPSNLTPLDAFLLQARADAARAPDPEEAIALYRSAIQLRDRAPGVSWFTLADNEIWTGFTLARSDRWSDARTHLAASRRILQSIGITDHSLLGTLDQLEGEDLLLHGRWAKAVARFSRSAAQAERSRSRLAPRLARAASGPGAFNIVAADALARNAFQEAWELREQGLAGWHADFAALGQWPALEPGTYARARELSLRLLDTTRRWKASGSAWTPSTAEILLERLEAKASLDALRTAYLAAHPPPPPDLPRVRSLLDRDTAMIGWLEVHVADSLSVHGQPMSSTGWAFVIRRDAPLQWVRLWETHGRAEWTAFTDFHLGNDRLVRAATWSERALPDAEMLTHLQERGRRYFDPLRPLLRGIRRLVVSGNIHLLPEAFVGPDGRFVAEEFEIVHIPSAVTLQVLSGSEEAQERAHSPRSILAVAATERTGLPRLPFLESEAAAVSRMFPRAVRLASGPRIHEELDALARGGELEGFDVIHLAGHTLRDVAAERDAIVLGGTPPFDRLTVEDVALSWRIRARLVTLSGCGSAPDETNYQGEPLAFTCATLAAGGTNVLSSLWPVDDRATLLLMSRFYANLSGAAGPPMTPSRALFEAKASVKAWRDPDGSRPFEHPAYWVGWTLFGTGR